MHSHDSWNLGAGAPYIRRPDNKKTAASHLNFSPQIPPKVLEYRWPKSSEWITLWISAQGAADPRCALASTSLLLCCYIVPPSWGHTHISTRVPSHFCESETHSGICSRYTVQLQRREVMYCLLFSSLRDANNGYLKIIKANQRKTQLQTLPQAKSTHTQPSLWEEERKKKKMLLNTITMEPWIQYPVSTELDNKQEWHYNWVQVLTDFLCASWVASWILSL